LDETAIPDGDAGWRFAPVIIIGVFTVAANAASAAAADAD